MTIRQATLDDLDAIQKLENVCFPENEAASSASFLNRLQVFPNHFWLLEANGKLIGLINGMVTHSDTITDEMFTQADLHNELGGWQSIFGLAIAPAFRRQGHAQELTHHLIEVAKQQNRKGVTLTCKESLIPYYEKLGFTNRGLSKSVHGGEVWYDMKIDL